MTQSGAIDFLEQLVLCSSPSGNEAHAALYSLERMKVLGFQDPHIDEAGNVIGRWGCKEAPRVYLIGHIDTVPGYIPVQRVERDGEEFLFGRGSVDAKGPFAAFVEAVSRLPRELPLSLVVAGVVEEEVASSKGARHLLHVLPEPAGVIIGEPSHTNGITLGYKGRLVLSLEMRGGLSHTASAALSVGDLMVELVTNFKSYVAQQNEDKEEGIFQSLDMTVQALSVDHDGLYEAGSLVVGFRLGPSFCERQIEHELSQIIREFSQQSQLEDLSFSFPQSEIPAVFSSRTPLAGAFRSSIRKMEIVPRHVYKTGTSDMNVLSREWSCPMLAYGPGDSALDHTPNEHLSLRDYLVSIEVLCQALQNLSSSTLVARTEPHGDSLTGVPEHRLASG